MSESGPATSEPVARSPIRVAHPVEIRAGWEVSTLRSYAPLRLADCSPLAKVLVRAPAQGRVARGLGVSFGRARRDEHATLVVGSGPGEWLLLSAPGTAAEVAARVDPSDDGLVSVLDLTHGRALMRLTGPAADQALSKVCAIDLTDAVTPDGAAFRTSVAKLATDVIRDDVRDDAASQDAVAGGRSYLLHCERSSGQYLYDALLDAGRDFGIEPDGFADLG